MPMPHSMPDFTSLASSLKRFSDDDLAGVDHHVVAQQAHLRVAVHLAVGDVAAGDGAHLGDLEGVAHLGRAQPHLADGRLEQALHGLLHVLDRVVDDGVEADLHLVALGGVRGLALRPHVEADDDRVGGGGQEHVAFADGARAGADDAQLDLLLRASS